MMTVYLLNIIQFILYMRDGMSGIEVDNLTFGYTEELVLHKINMSIAPGSFVALLGQSGCGKSTLLRLLAGLEKPGSGKILIGNQEIKGAGLDKGMVFQDYGLFPWMTAGENIAFALEQRFPKAKKKELKQMALKLLADVDLKSDVYDKLPKELSGGMQQRCAITKAFGIDPPIMLMDEPFGALDAVTRSRLQDLIINLWSKDEEKKTVIFVTHDVDEAIFLANEIYVLGQMPGSIIYHYVFDPAKRPDRSKQFDDEQTAKLRITLMSIIHKDVEAKKEKVETKEH